MGGELKTLKQETGNAAIDISKLLSFHEVGGVTGLWEKAICISIDIGSNFNVFTSINFY